MTAYTQHTSGGNLEYHSYCRVLLRAFQLKCTTSRTILGRVFVQTRSFQALVAMVEDDRLAQSRQSELVKREKEATQAVKKLEADLHAERADHCRQVGTARTAPCITADGDKHFTVLV